jgi:hypothetical protein
MFSLSTVVPFCLFLLLNAVTLVLLIAAAMCGSCVDLLPKPLDAMVGECCTHLLDTLIEREREREREKKK